MRRPLEQSQLAYAADDVRYLRALHDHLRSELNQRTPGRCLRRTGAAARPQRFELDEAALLKK